MANLVVLYGGSQTEHLVSRVSGATIFKAAQGRHSVELIGITPDGKWHRASTDTKDIKSENEGALSAVLSVEGPIIEIGAYLEELRERPEEDNVVVFPVLHGPGGEDGSIQAKLQEYMLPFVGAGVDASKNCINKLLTKQILEEAGLSVTPYHKIQHQVLFPKNNGENSIQNGVGLVTEIISELGATNSDWKLPLILKPSSYGSSVGVHLLKEMSDTKEAVIQLQEFESDFILEQYINDREMECSLLELSDKKYLSSVPGEIISSDDIYSYKDKYIADTAQIIAPAVLEPELVKRFQETTIQVAQALNVEGLARVDYFLRDTEILINEVNTMPGFTPISMYPRLLALENIGMEELVDRLIELAIFRSENS